MGIGIYSDAILMCIERMDQFSKSKSAALGKIQSLSNEIKLDNTTMQSDTRVTNRYICLMGKIQPAMLDKLLNDQLQRAGLAARFLPSYGEKN